MKYTVTNAYGLAGESSHRTVKAALKRAASHEGIGWVVTDSDGNQWADNAGTPYITRRSDET